MDTFVLIFLIFLFSLGYAFIGLKHVGTFTCGCVYTWDLGALHLGALTVMAASGALRRVGGALRYNAEMS